MQAGAVVTSARRRSASSSACGGAKNATVCAEELQCSICFDVLTFPVTLPCGYVGEPMRCMALRVLCLGMMLMKFVVCDVDRHNFDRGCILTAWAFEARQAADRDNGGNELGGDADDSDSDDNNNDGLRRQPSDRSRRQTQHQNEDAGGLCAHSCPLCRQCVWLTEPGDELQLNRPLQGVVSSLFPLEIARAGTPDKQQPRAHCSNPTTQTRASQSLEPVTLRVDPHNSEHQSNGLVEFLRRPSLRTLSSLLSVSVASLYTVPPGFTLAVLLLLALAAIACAPPATFGVATSSAASPLLLLTLEAVDRVCNGLGLLIRDLSLQLDRPLALIVHLVAVLW